MSNTDQFIESVIANMDKEAEGQPQRFKSVGSDYVKRLPMSIMGVPGYATFFRNSSTSRGRTFIPEFTWKSAARNKRPNVAGYTRAEDFYVELSYDNSNGNGYNSFSICIQSGECWTREEDLMNAVFPEFTKLLKWHLCNSKVSECVGDFTYHFNDRDYNGVREGELKQMITGGDPNKCMWRLKIDPASLSGVLADKFAKTDKTPGGNYDTYHLGDIFTFSKDGEKPPTPVLVWEPIYYTSGSATGSDKNKTGKPRNIETAIRLGYWFDCPVEELMLLDDNDRKEAYLKVVPTIRRRFLTAMHEAGIPLSMDDPLWPAGSPQS